MSKQFIMKAPEPIGRNERVRGMQRILGSHLDNSSEQDVAEVEGAGWKADDPH